MLLQGVLELAVRVRMVVALLKILCTVCGTIGLLGALQAFPSVAVMTKSVTQVRIFQQAMPCRLMLSEARTGPAVACVHLL